ncbi:energy transducer TonB [Sphingobium subterraneum]|uniref:Protein TonB n=1 Tax=Sphingobium subterraneum TaxID=627688 RepID=A0A841J149_9SPHN|nr:energy transducer TonB [Sphingobium subterraneum]MBB6124072.1 protein TonB [Sphingobium subterraneum]
MIRFPDHAQPATTGYTGQRTSPTAITAAIAVHAVVAGAIILMPPQIVKAIKDPFIKVHWVEPDPTPPPPPTSQPEPRQKVQKARTTPNPDPQPRAQDPIVPSGNSGGDVLTWPTGGSGDGGGIMPADPPPPPVITEARPDPARMKDFQPPYPASMIRAQIEGFATVRVHITAQGRVDAIERIEATSDAFWSATREQALSRWRFRPATRDGVAIESERVMTVRFRLD